MNSAGYNGVYVDSTGYTGFTVYTAGTVGFNVHSAGSYGVYVGTAGYDGINAYGAAYAGNFVGDINVTGNCIGCLQANFAVNAGERTLQPGDVVSIQAVTHHRLRHRTGLVASRAGPTRPGCRRRRRRAS